MMLCPSQAAQETMIVNLSNGPATQGRAHASEQTVGTGTGMWSYENLWLSSGHRRLRTGSEVDTGTSDSRTKHLPLN